MAHTDKPVDDSSPLITRLFAADVACPVHGTDLGTIVLTGPIDLPKAGEVMSSIAATVGVRHSGLLEVTGDPAYARLLAMGLIF